MRVTGNVEPDAVVVEQLRNGIASVRIRENINQTDFTDPESGIKISGFLYDEYILNVPYIESLKSEVLEHMQEWVETGKSLEYNPNASAFADLESATAVFGFSTQAEAMAMRPAIEKAVQSLPDADALTVKPLYPHWEELVKLGTVEAETGYKFCYDGDLYRCRNANPQFQETWIPGIDTAALYERIDETHAGTVDDPIPYDGNMELKNGVYYSQDGITYKCTRDTGIPVYHPLKDLVGIYVEVVA